MTIVHARLVGDQAVLPRAELERLMELAQLKDLEDLTISKGQFTDKVMDDLRKALPKTNVHTF